MDRNFLASCQTHDACYSISNRDKNECDEQFKENLEVLCEKENIAFCDAIIWAAGYATGHKGQLKHQIFNSHRLQQNRPSRNAILTIFTKNSTRLLGYESGGSIAAVLLNHRV